MAENAEYQRAMEAEIKAKLAAQAEGPVASPSVPYTKYIMMDKETAPGTFPPELVNAVYDREISLTFLDEWKQNWLQQQHMRAENLFAQGRPMMSNTHRNAIALSVMAAKLMVKLSRSTLPQSQRGTTNERMLQATQIVTKQVTTSGGAMPAARGSRWRFLGRKKEVAQT